MKKLLIFMLLIISSFLYNSAFAHPGNTASDGCHYCRTNCDSWGVAWNERHCHGGGSSDYYTPSYTPTYISCPSNSYSSGGSCYCNSGYELDSTKSYCVKEKTGDELCKESYGIYSYGIGTSCYCSSGYEWNLSQTYCTKSKTCSDIYGYNSQDNLDGTTCSCKFGYEWDSTKTSCVKPKTGDEVCKQSYGINSYSYLNLCYCNSGYDWNSDKTSCTKIKEKTPTESCQDVNGIYSYADGTIDSDGYYNCFCNSGYEYSSNESACIKIKEKEKTGDELCQQTYGLNSKSIGVKNNNGTYNCSCTNGYEWNSTQTSCIITNVIVISDKNKQQAEKIFNSIQSKISKLPEDKKQEIYSSILTKIDKIKLKANGDTLLIINHLYSLIKTLQGDSLLDELLNG